MSRCAGFRSFLAVLTALLVFQRAGAEPIVVMSYNVANWLTADRFIDNKRVPPSPKPDSEKEAVVNVIISHRPDILGVIEMGDRKDLEDLRARLKAKGLNYPHVEWHEGIDTDRHVALLSRFPIVARHSQDKVMFDLNGKPEAIKRGILDAIVEIKRGYRLRLIGLHLKSRRKVPNVDEEALRAKEAWLVRQYLDKILRKDPKTKLLLYGDLNTTKNEYPIKQIQGRHGSRSRMIDIPIEDDRHERWTHYYLLADDYSRIDYLMASPALHPEVDLAKSGIDHTPHWNDASDHRAIYVTIDPK